MNTAKITAVAPSLDANGMPKSWQGQYGLMYTFTVTLDNGMTAEINSKTQATRWKVGDQVIFEHTPAANPQHLGKFKLSKPQAQGGGGSYNPKDMNRTTSLRYAVDLCKARKIDNPDEVAKIAKYFENKMNEQAANETKYFSFGLRYAVDLYGDSKMASQEIVNRAVFFKSKMLPDPPTNVANPPAQPVQHAQPVQQPVQQEIAHSQTPHVASTDADDDLPF